MIFLSFPLHTKTKGFAGKRSQSMNTVNGMLIAGTNSEGGGQQYSSLASPSRTQKNRVIVTSAQVNNCKTNYVNSLQKKFKRNPSILKNPNNCTAKTNGNKPKKQKAEAVKMWLFKSIVQVRPNEQQQQRNGGSSPQSFQNNIATANGHESAINNELDHNGGTTVGGGNQGVELKDDGAAMSDVTTYTFCRHAIRSTYMDKSIEAKKKVRVGGFFFRIGLVICYIFCFFVYYI